jgi:predicted  nucleic acid-binding Zn-ribbon protein
VEGSAGALRQRGETQSGLQVESVSATLDDHIRATLDRIRVSLSGQLEADFSTSTSDILRAVADEHRRALVEATEQTAATMRSEAEQLLAAARDEFAREREELARQREELQKSSTSEITGLERVLGEVRDELDVSRRGLDDLRSAREALERQIEESNQSLERHRQDLDQRSQELEQASRDLAQRGQELEQVSQDLEHSRQNEESTRQELQESIERAQGEREHARLETESLVRAMEELRTKLAQTARLTSAFRTLDQAASLGDILEHLAQSACQESGRTAVFLVNGGKLRGWRALGFPEGQPIVGSDFDPAESGVVGQVVRSGAGQQFRNGDATHLPAFAQADGPRDAVALPVQVGGSVIAVLYADAARADRPEDPEWLESIDAMTKHAGRVLEAMTVRQAAALWAPPRGVVRSKQE